MITSHAINGRNLDSRLRGNDRLADRNFLEIILKESLLNNGGFIQKGKPMRALLMYVIAISSGLNLIASDHGIRPVIAGGYSIHLGAQQFLLTKINLEKSDLLKSIILNPFVPIPLDGAGIGHIYLQGQPEDFVPVYRYLTQGIIDANSQTELDHIKLSASSFQVPELVKDLARVTVKKKPKKDEYIWVKSAKILCVMPADTWTGEAIHRLNDSIASIFEDQKNIKTSSVKDLGFDRTGYKYVLVLNKEEWPNDPSGAAKTWKRKTQVFKMSPYNKGQPKIKRRVYRLEQTDVDRANRRLDELFNDATKKRLIKISPLGFTGFNSLLLLLVYDEASGS